MNSLAQVGRGRCAWNIGDLPAWDRGSRCAKPTVGYRQKTEDMIAVSILGDALLTFRRSTTFQVGHTVRTCRMIPTDTQPVG